VRRHRFEPAVLVTGLVLLSVSAGFGLDAGGVWDLSAPRRSVLLVGGALAVAATVAVVTQVARSVRGRRTRRRAPHREDAGHRSEAA